MDIDGNVATKPPITGLERNEAIRVQGPLILGAHRDDSGWAWTQRNACEKDLADHFGIPEPEVLRDSELICKFNRIYDAECSDELGPLLDFLCAFPIDSGKMAVNLLFWGNSKVWDSPLKKQEWVDAVLSCPEGPALREWFNACLCTARCDIIEPCEPHKEPNRAPANQPERDARDSQLPRMIVDLLSCVCCPVFVFGRFWTKSQLETLGNVSTLTGFYRELL